MPGPQFTVISSNTSKQARVATAGASALSKFIAEQAAHYGFVGQDAAALESVILGNDALNALAPDRLRAVVLNAFDHVSKTNPHDGAAALIDRAKHVKLEDMLKALNTVDAQHGIHIPPRPEMMQVLRERIAANDAQEVARPANAAKNWIANTSHEQRVNGGLWMIGAGLGLIGTYNAAKNARHHDENGRPQMQWSNVGIALLQACMTAGCAYMGAQAMRGGRAF